MFAHISKGEFVTVLNEAPRNENVLGSGSTALNLSTTWSGQLHVPTAFPPGKKPRGTHWTGS